MEIRPQPGLSRSTRRPATSGAAGAQTPHGGGRASQGAGEKGLRLNDLQQQMDRCLGDLGGLEGQYSQMMDAVAAGSLRPDDPDIASLDASLTSVGKTIGSLDDQLGQLSGGSGGGARRTSHPGHAPLPARPCAPERPATPEAPLFPGSAALSSPTAPGVRATPAGLAAHVSAPRPSDSASPLSVRHDPAPVDATQGVSATPNPTPLVPPIGRRDFHVAGLPDGRPAAGRPDQPRPGIAPDRASVAAHAAGSRDANAEASPGVPGRSAARQTPNAVRPDDLQDEMEAMQERLDALTTQNDALAQDAPASQPDFRQVEWATEKRAGSNQAR